MVEAVVMDDYTELKSSKEELLEKAGFERGPERFDPFLERIPSPSGSGVQAGGGEPADVR